MADTDSKGIDKLYHFLACLIAAILHPFFAAGLALGKEYGDYKAAGNHWCWWDILYDFLGIVAGSALWWVLWYVIIK